MLRRTLPFVALLLFAANGASTFAQESPAKTGEQKDAPKTDATPAPESTPKPSAGRYKELVYKLKNGERDVDFTELRMAYTESEDYNPSESNHDARIAMSTAFVMLNSPGALKISSKMLEKNYTDIYAHYGMAVGNKNMGDDEKADFHKFVFQGLFDSVRGVVDGKSAGKAFVVISSDEEDALIYFLGLSVKSKVLLDEGSRAYDKIVVIDPKTGKPYDLYFQIDIPSGWLRRNGKGSSEEKKP